MSPRVATAEKRLRISLLLDAYGELLTEKQRDFLRRYYEEDYSFGEIARDYSVSRQAIFDSVKHGEAALENYERVLGLVEARSGMNGSGRTPLAESAGRAADVLRQWGVQAANGRAPAPEEMEALAEELERVAAELRGAVMSGTPESSLDRAPVAVPADRGGALRLGDGPEID
jgi:predicted DNA-binding protein YlxM (UPF0122 family)